MEGSNNKIKAIKRTEYGFRSFKKLSSTYSYLIQE
nr:transposase [Weissella cibaria]